MAQKGGLARAGLTCEKKAVMGVLDDLERFLELHILAVYVADGIQFRKRLFFNDKFLMALWTGHLAFFLGTAFGLGLG